MKPALVIGGTGFIGQYSAVELHDHGYDVTTISRGTQTPSLAELPTIDHVVADRTDRDALADVARRVDPAVVIDCAAFHPDEIQTAIDLFADVDAYVYVSSGAVYRVQEIPKREDETPLHDCTAEQATDDSMATYGPRKAACDRLVTAAAERGVAATSVRPTVVYGPQTIQTGNTGSSVAAPSWAEEAPGIQFHHDYWIDRVNRYDRVIVPGDGTAIWHRAYVEDVASALRIVAEHGQPGEAYNVGDRRVCTIEDVIELIADALETSVEVVYAGRRELAQVGLEPSDFVLYHHPWTEYPHVLDTCKLIALDWVSTDPETAMARTVDESLTSGRRGAAHDPGRGAEEVLLELITD